MGRKLAWFGLMAVAGLVVIVAEVVGAIPKAKAQPQRHLCSYLAFHEEGRMWKTNCQKEA